jgi:hypothetical protein
VSEELVEADAINVFRALVRSAFRAAKASGKRDWDVMTTAVLKNRLLQLTSGKFVESAYGEDHLLPLLRAIPDVVQLIEEPGRSWKVRLIDADGQSEEVSVEEARSGIPSIERSSLSDSSSKRRVRPDLWRAVVDYASGRPYFWHEGKNRAYQGEEFGAAPVLPTLTPEEAMEWRQGFVAAQEQKGVDSIDSLAGWAAGVGKTSDLPGKFRGLWNEYLKAAVVARLDRWFTEHSIEPPSDVLVDVKDVRPSREARSVAAEQLLREALIRAIVGMDYESLLRVSVPASALLVEAGIRTLREAP